MEQKTKNWNTTNDREINLADLLWRMLESWRLVIILAVVCAVLAAGYSYRKSSQQAEQLANTETVEVEMSDTEAQQVENARVIRSQLEDRLEYQRDSVLMNLDPYHKERMVLLYYIDSDTVDRSSVSLLLNSYSTYIDSRAIVSDISGTAGLSVDDVYLGELISYDSFDADMDRNMEFSWVQEQLQKMEENHDEALRIYLTAADSKELNQLADAVEKAIRGYHKKLSRDVAPHQMALLGRYQSTTVDTDLAQKQMDTQSAIEGLQTRLNTLTDTFNDAQKAVLGESEESADQEQEGADAVQEASAASVSKKYVLLGVILGIVLACVWVALRYILDGRVKSADELQNSYGVRILGSVKTGKKKKRLFSGIDDWIASLQNKSEWSVEEQMQVLLANITVSCQKEEITRVFLTSESLDEGARAQIDEMANLLRAEGIEAVYETNIAYNAASLKHMAEIANVILIVEGAHTKYRELEKELMLCADQDITVLGTVFLS